MGVYKIELESETKTENQSFTAWAFVEEDGALYGISQNNNGIKTRRGYLVGVLISHGKKCDIAFHELFNNPGKVPLLYVVANIGKRMKRGTWSEFHDFGDYREKGKVKITIKEVFDMTQSQIEAMWEDIDMEANSNMEHMARSYECRARIARAH